MGLTIERLNLLKHSAEIQSMIKNLIFENRECSESDILDALEFIEQKTGISVEQLNIQIEQGVLNGVPANEQITIIRSLLGVPI